MGMLREEYHYLIAGLGMTELNFEDYRHSGVNITGFQVTPDVELVTTMSPLKQNITFANKINQPKTITKKPAEEISQTATPAHEEKWKLFMAKLVPVLLNEFVNGTNASNRYPTSHSQLPV